MVRISGSSPPSNIPGPRMMPFLLADLTMRLEGPQSVHREGSQMALPYLHMHRSFLAWPRSVLAVSCSAKRLSQFIFFSSRFFRLSSWRIPRIGFDPSAQPKLSLFLTGVRDKFYRKEKGERGNLARERECAKHTLRVAFSIPCSFLEAFAALASCLRTSKEPACGIARRTLQVPPPIPRLRLGSPRAHPPAVRFSCLKPQLHRSVSPIGLAEK